jgi:predicted esterase
MKGIQNYLKSPPLFCFHGNCDKVCPTDSDFFLAYLVPLDVSYAMLRVDFFKMTGNGQNAKNSKSTKIIIVGYLPDRN